MIRRYKSGKPYARFCGPMCAESFKCDRQGGAIYPALHTPAGCYSAERWSLVNGTCCYCGEVVAQSPRIDLHPEWGPEHSLHPEAVAKR